MSLLDDWGNATPSPLSAAIAHRRAADKLVIDHITASPTTEGIVFSPALLREAIDAGIASAQHYRPDARGRLDAREAIARVYGFPRAEDIILTPGTSFAYWAIFRLLAADGGGEVLVPSPSYPLFGDLAALAGCRTRHYHLTQRGDGPWRLDPDELEFQITPATRVIVLVSPHNPTGHVIDTKTMAAIGALAARHNIALVLDEVFRDLLVEATKPSSLGDAVDAPLTFTLNGLSKGHVLPTMKVAWMAVGGVDVAWRAQVLNALDYLLDTFLPVNEIAQGAAPILLLKGASEVARLNAILRGRLDTMLGEWREGGLDVLRPDGGPYLLFPVPMGVEATTIALELAEHDGVLVHPGELYGLATPHLVTTCVAQRPWGLDAIARRLGLHG